MGKTLKKIKKTLKGIGNLSYVEIRHVPMAHDPDYGFGIHSKILGEIEKSVAQELIVGRYRIRGQEVSFLRSVFALSKRQLAEKLGLSHVAIVKWEKSKNKPLALVNEVTIKALMSGLLGLKMPASLDNLVGKHDIPKKLVLDYEDDSFTQIAA